MRNAHSCIIKQTSDGGYILAGDALFDGSSYGDIAVLKLDSDGNVVWQKAYSGTGTSSDEAGDIIETADGGYILLGSVFNTFGGTAFWVLKLDAAGNTVWQEMFGGSHEDYAHRVLQTADGGYIIAGSTYSFGSGNSDIWVLKLTGSGSVSWQKAYGGPGYEFGSSIQQTSDGQYVIAGSTMPSAGNSTADILVISLDQNGNIVWQKTYAGSQYDSASAIQETPDGGYIVAGGTYSFGAGIEDVLVLKLDVNGNLIWQKTYGGISNDFANDIKKTSDNCYIVAAITYSSFPLGNILIFKIANEGTILWQKTYGGSSIDFVRSIEQTEDGGYIAGGSSGSFDDNEVFFTLKFDASGDIPDCAIAATGNVSTSDSSLSTANTNFITMSPSYNSSTFPSVRTINLDDSPVCPGPTLINLAYFAAHPATGNVILKWSTESEIDNAGFNLYRSQTEDGEYIKINNVLIAAQGSPGQGASYEFIDTAVQNRKTYWYKLEDIDLNGVSTFHGPVSVTPRLLFGIR